MQIKVRRYYTATRMATIKQQQQLQLTIQTVGKEERQLLEITG